MSGLRVLVASSEVAGFAKTGGLADVVAALPRSILDHVEALARFPFIGPAYESGEEPSA